MLKYLLCIMNTVCLVPCYQRDACCQWHKTASQPKAVSMWSLPTNLMHPTACLCMQSFCYGGVRVSMTVQCDMLSACRLPRSRGCGAGWQVPSEAQKAHSMQGVTQCLQTCSRYGQPNDSQQTQLAECTPRFCIGRLADAALASA